MGVIKIQPTEEEVVEALKVVKTFLMERSCRDCFLSKFCDEYFDHKDRTTSFECPGAWDLSLLKRKGK